MRRRKIKGEIMNSEEMIPNKRYKNVVVDGCEFAWVRLVRKPMKRMIIAPIARKLGLLRDNQNAKSTEA